MNSVRALSRWKAIALCLIAAAATFLLLETSFAQEETEYQYVDLVMTHEYDGQDVIFKARNFGTEIATGVVVSYHLKDLETYISSPNIRDKRTDDSTKEQWFTWEVGTLRPGQTSVFMRFSTLRHSGHTTVGQIGVITATAESDQPEPDFLLGNNELAVYSFAKTAGVSLHMPYNRLALLLSADDLRPGVGGDVDFTLSANSLNPKISQGTTLIGGIKIKVKLSDGLVFKSDWTPPDTFVISDTDNQSATWTPADVETNDPQEVVIETQLTSDSLDDIPLEERCITAWVVDSLPPPSPDYALGSLKQCLGDDPPLLLEEGSVAFLTSFPCTADAGPHQCQSTPGVAVAARLPSRHADYVQSNDFDANLRSHGVGRSDEHASGQHRAVFVDPESVFIQVKDPGGRVQDSHTDSVSDVSWQTARKAISGKNRAVDGVTITYTRKDIKDKDAWKSLGPRTLTVTRADGTTPGKVKIRLISSGNQFLDLSSGTATRNAFNITTVSTLEFPYFAEFETLGTYLIKYDLTLTDSGDNAYTDSGTYTFHVGPWRSWR